MPPFLEFLALGGPVVLVLLVMSIVGLAIVLYKAIQLRRFSRMRLRQSERLLTARLESESPSDCTTIDQTHLSPVASVLQLGLDWLQDERSDDAVVREELQREGNGIVSQVSSHLWVLEQIASIAPLLGLLGTVLGIIDVFHGLASANSAPNAGALADGIWEALLTTAVGLSVAIPFALIHSVFVRHVEFVRSSLENQLTRLFTASLRHQFTRQKVQ